MKIDDEFFASIDGGETWEKCTFGPPTVLTYIIRPSGQEGTELPLAITRVEFEKYARGEPAVATIDKQPTLIKRGVRT